MQEYLIIRNYLKELNSTNLQSKKYYNIVPFLAKIYADNLEELKELISIGNLVVTETLDAYSYLDNKIDLTDKIQAAIIVEYNYFLSIKENLKSNNLNEISYSLDMDTKIDVKSILENLNEFEKEYILYKYGFYDGLMRSFDECCDEFKIQKEFGNLFENKMIKKMRKIYFLKS